MKKDTTTKTGALYIRVSTDEQAELSPDAQKRLLLDYAKKNNIIISEDYIFTESVSGRHAQKRPQGPCGGKAGRAAGRGPGGGHDPGGQYQ